MIMSTLKDNIDHYMKLKGIKKYSYLLIDIAHELGIKGQEAYEFAKKEKSNFSKMLKGYRPLKHDFIIPLEKIFGISLARLLEEDAYKLPVQKENVPFDKGFRYYAYLDDPKLYKEEFDLLLTKDGKSIITRTDEFDKTFLDYLVEYHSVNGVRYLYEEYGIKLKYFHNQFTFNKNKGVTWINLDNAIGFARLVASMNDVDLFNDIYDTYNMFFSNGHYAAGYCIFGQDEYLEIILDNDGLFNSIFEVKAYEFKIRNTDENPIIYHPINPIINGCLRYALQHLDLYRHRAVKILEFGIEHNLKIASETASESCYICDELGGLKDFRNKDYSNIVIFVDVEVEDDKINSLINELPKFSKHY